MSARGKRQIAEMTRWLSPRHLLRVPFVNVKSEEQCFKVYEERRLSSLGCRTQYWVFKLRIVPNFFQGKQSVWRRKRGWNRHRWSPARKVRVTLTCHLSWVAIPTRSSAFRSLWYRYAWEKWGTTCSLYNMLPTVWEKPQECGNK